MPGITCYLSESVYHLQVEPLENRLGIAFQAVLKSTNSGIAVGTESDRREGENTADTACPKCGARVVLRKVSNPSLEPSGPAGYVIQCNECRTWLTGIIDPDDGAFVLL